MSNIKGGIREAAMQRERGRCIEKISQSYKQWALQTCGIGRKEKSKVISRCIMWVPGEVENNGKE